MNSAGTFSDAVDFNAVSGTLNSVEIDDSTALALQAMTLTGNLTVSAGGNVTNTGKLDIGGSTKVTVSSNSYLANLNTTTNDFTGAVSIHGAGIVNLTDINAIEIGQMESTRMILTAGGAVTQTPSGALAITQAHGLTIKAWDGSSVYYDITLNNQSNDLSLLAVTYGANVAITDTNAIILGASTVTGTYDITAGGAVTDNGALAITGAATIIAQSSNGATDYAITLDNTSHNFGTIGVKGAAVELVDAGAIDLGASTVSGAYEVTATSGGDITDSGVLNITGAATFTAAAGQSVTLNNDNIFSGTVTFATPSGSLKNVEITDTTPLLLSALTLAQVASAGGNLIVTAGGAVTNDGTLVIPGATTISASGQDVTLNSSNNNFTGAVSIIGKIVAVTDTNGIELGTSTVSETYTITAGGAVTESSGGTLRITGATTIAASSQNVTLNETANNFIGAVGITGAAVAVRDVGEIKLGTSAVSGTYTVTAAGEVSNNGALDIEGVTTISASDQDVTLDHASNDFENDVLITGKIVKVVDVDTIDLGASTVSGTYTVTAGNAVTQSGILDIEGATDITSGNGTTNITLNALDNDFTGAVSLKSHHVRVKDVNGIDLGNITSASGGVLQVTAGGDVTNTGILNINGVTTISASGQDVALNNPDNNFRDDKAVRITARNVDVVDRTGIKLGVSTVTGTYKITAGDAVTNSDNRHRP